MTKEKTHQAERGAPENQQWIFTRRWRNGGKLFTFKLLNEQLSSQEIIILVIQNRTQVAPVAFSLMASFMSAITLLGVTQENYTYGTQVSRRHDIMSHCWFCFCSCIPCHDCSSLRSTLPTCWQLLRQLTYSCPSSIGCALSVSISESWWWWLWSLWW